MASPLLIRQMSRPEVDELANWASEGADGTLPLKPDLRVAAGLRDIVHQQSDREQ